MTELNLLAVQNAAVLRALKPEASGLSIADLARSLNRDGSNLSKTLKALDEAGLVTLLPRALTAAGRDQLAALDRAEGAAETGQGFTLTHDQIRPDPDNARRDWDSDSARADLAALANDIADNGLLQNLVVRDGNPTAGDFILVGGERRWRAIGQLIEGGRLAADWPIPCRLLETDDLGVRLAALSENLQRRNLNPIEEATAYRGLREAGLTTEQISERIGLTQRLVQMRLQLLEHLSEADQQRMTLSRDDPAYLSVSDARQLVQKAEAHRKALDKALADYTPRQRLILAELRAATGEGYICQSVEVDGAAMLADPEAIALDKAGIIHVPTSLNHEGKALARCEHTAWSLCQTLWQGHTAADYATTLRAELELAPPALGQWSTPWMNGPFEVTPELQVRIDEQRAAQQAQEAEWKARREKAEADRRAEAERMAMARTHAEAMLAKAAVAPAMPALPDAADVVRAMGMTLPLRATATGAVIDAADTVLTDFNGYGPATDEELTLAILMATVVNAAAGLDTPPLVPLASDDEEEVA